MAQIVPEIEERRARRAISEESIDKATIERIFDAATKAPSCSNKQPWRFLVATEGQALENAREALLGGNYWAKKAPVLVVVTTRDEFDCQLSDDRNYAQFDTGMAIMGLMMQATREGFYAHPMAGFEPATLREKFKIEPETRIITMVAIGRPGDSSHLNEKHGADETSERTRKSLDEVIQWNGWSSLG